MVGVSSFAGATQDNKRRGRGCRRRRRRFYHRRHRFPSFCFSYRFE